MEEKFNGEYRIPSARASWWDYGNPGAYFVTICTKDRVCVNTPKQIWRKAKVSVYYFVNHQLTFQDIPP